MEGTLKELIKISKEIPENYIREAIIKLNEIKEKAKTEKETIATLCTRCGSENLYKNGKRHDKQAYLCKECGKTFVETSTSSIAYSHNSETTWKQVIQDTVDGLSIDKTAKSLELSHSTVFNMRHKILTCVENEIKKSNIILTGVNEADETYVLENLKGRKIPEDYHRKPREHGAKASTKGISSEFICVCASVDQDNNCMAVSVNRASPSKSEIGQVFNDKVSSDTIILCDGNKNYDCLNDRCTVAHTERVNRVNGFHSFIKGRLSDAHGVATIYLNRYNAFFSQIFGKADTIVNKIYELMVVRNDSFISIKKIKKHNLLNI